MVSRRRRRVQKVKSRSPRRVTQPKQYRGIILFVVFILLSIGVAREIYRMPSAKELQALKTNTVNQTSTMKARQQSAQEKYKIHQRWVSFANISPAITKATVASEDARFFSHEGLDWEEINNALHGSLRQGTFTRGASTITQQVAKNLYLSEDRSLLRKAREALLAWRIEKTLSKKEILTIYLNIAEWGNGIFGVEAAARTYFNKPASNLNLAESCILAAMLPNPHRINFKNPKLLLNKANLVLRRVESEHLASSLSISRTKADFVKLLNLK